MTENPIEGLHKLGQSLWYDNIERRLLENGGLESMITAGDIRGITSNPSIFQKSITSSSDYDAALEKSRAAGLDALKIYEALAISDISQAATRTRIKSRMPQTMFPSQVKNPFSKESART